MSLNKQSGPVQRRVLIQDLVLVHDMNFMRSAVLLPTLQTPFLLICIAVL